MKALSDVEIIPFLSSKSFPRYSRPIVLILLIILFTLGLRSIDNVRKTHKNINADLEYAISDGSGKAFGKIREAQRLYPEELMRRTRTSSLTSIPKLLHQSWINDTLPAKFKGWSHTCRKAHPDWEWVLWTDKDNLNLIERFAPWFAKTYDALQLEIYRADAVRNVYMHVFGGVYADLDTECMLSYDSMFAKYNVSTITYNETSLLSETVEEKEDMSKNTSSVDEASTPISQDKTSTGINMERKAFLGRMGTDVDFPHSIPNAWMASTPGHPFWLLPLESVAENLSSGAIPEAITGPVALREQVEIYNSEFAGGEGEKMDDHYAKSEWRHLFKQSSTRNLTQSVVILPHWEVYPYSWRRDGEAVRDVCEIANATLFDSAKCKTLLRVDYWGSHSITYWSHSWGFDADGRWGEHMDAINKPDEEPYIQDYGRDKGRGDALKENKLAEQQKKKQELQDAKEAEMKKDARGLDLGPAEPVAESG